MFRSPAARPSLAPALGAVVLAGIVLGGFAPGPAAAHADLVESTPSPNASLIEPPDELRLVFSEPIDPDVAFVDLLDAAQQRVTGLGAMLIDEEGHAVSIALPQLDAGAYTVTYQVLSAIDGHATTGVFAFVVDPTGTEAPPAVPPGERSPSVDGWTIAARWVALGGAIVALGSLLLWWRSRPVLGEARASGAPWSIIGGGAVLALLGLAAYLLLAARPIVGAVADRGGGFALDIAAPFGWTPFAIAMRLALAGVLIASVLAAVGWRRAASEGAGALALGTGLALGAGLAGMSLAAHASAAGGPAFAAIDWAHLVAVAAWLGGLPAVAIIARRGGGASNRDVARRILHRHGPVALVAAPTVVLTGLANSPLVLGDARGLVGSGYGNLLLAKAGLLSVAVGIGAVNFFVLRGRGRASISTLVAAEVIVAALAVGAAATMVTIQPAAARQPAPTAAPVTPAHLFGDAGPTSIHATVNLPSPGLQSYQVTVADAESGIPRDDVQRVFLELTPPSGAGPAPDRVELDASPDQPGLYTTSGAYLSAEGDWTIDVVVRRAGALDEAATFTVPVRQPSPPRLAPPPDTGIGIPAPIGLLWSVLPTGPAAWLPALAALVAIGAATVLLRGRPSAAATGTRFGLLLILAVAVLGGGSRTLVAAANAPTPEELADHATPTGLVISLGEGEAIYRANCAACHGTEGDGAGPVRTLPRAGPLPDSVRAMTSAELSYRIANGYAGTAMPAFAAALTEAERWNLVAYLEDRWR